MSNEIIKYDFGPSKLKPLSTSIFVSIFLVGGFFLNFVVQIMLSGIGVLCAFCIAIGFQLLKATGLDWISWVLIVPYVLIWWPLNYFFQAWFIRAFSALAGMRRFQSAIVLTISTLPFLIFFLWVGGVGRQAPTAGDVVYYGSIIGFIAQIIECLRIYKLRSLPLYHFAVLPKGGRKREQINQLLSALENARTQPQFEQMTLKVLEDMHLGELKLRTTTEAPVAVLLQALVKNKELNRADAISQSYLRVVDTAGGISGAISENSADG